jgi:hypothetical protein
MLQLREASPHFAMRGKEAWGQEAERKSGRGCWTRQGCFVGGTGCSGGQGHPLVATARWSSGVTELFKFDCVFYCLR